MQLVDVVEAEIGHPVEAWPTQILTIIFAFDPHMAFALSQLEKVIAFFTAIMFQLIWHINSSLPAASSPITLPKMHLHTFIPNGLSILIWAPIVCISI